MEGYEYRLSLTLAKEALQAARRLLAGIPDGERRRRLKRRFEPSLREEAARLNVYHFCRRGVIYLAAYPRLNERADDVCARLEILHEEVRRAVSPQKDTQG